MFRRTFYDGTYSIDIFEAGHIGNGSRKGARPILVATPCRPPAHEENGLSEAGEETIIVDMIIEEPVPGIVDTPDHAWLVRNLGLQQGRALPSRCAEGRATAAGESPAINAQASCRGCGLRSDQRLRREPHQENVAAADC
jgi:hypothetical protein